MPAGLGWHPYFPRTPRTTVTAAVSALWRTDAEMMPTALRAAARPRPRGAPPDAVALDNGFAGWSAAPCSGPSAGASLVDRRAAARF